MKLFLSLLAAVVGVNAAWTVHLDEPKGDVYRCDDVTQMCLQNGSDNRRKWNAAAYLAGTGFPTRSASDSWTTSADGALWQSSPEKISVFLAPGQTFAFPFECTCPAEGAAGPVFADPVWAVGPNAEQLGSIIEGEGGYDESGSVLSISADGSIIAIGARQNDGDGGLGDDRGHVRIYQFDESNGWSQLGTDIDGEAALDNSGVSVSLSTDGTRVAIGAPGNDDKRGHVRVFDYDSVSHEWNQVGSDIDGEAAGEYSGISVSLSSDGLRLAIGAAWNDAGGVKAGSVRVLGYDGAGWSKIGQDIVGSTAGEQFGGSVSLSWDGSTVAIGAGGAASKGANTGVARIYNYNGVDSWNQLGSDLVGEASSVNLGRVVSLSSDGTRVALGAPGSTASVRIFDYDTANGWTQVGTNIVGHPDYNYGGFGTSVSLSSDGSRVAIGAPTEGPGKVQIYDYDSVNGWAQVGTDIVGGGGGYNDKNAGYCAMSLDGSRVVIGAPGTTVVVDETVMWSAGITKVFALPAPAL